MHLQGCPGGGLGGHGMLRRASIIVRPSSQSRTRNAAWMQSATNAPTGNLKLNRKTAGQPFSYSSFKLSCPCGDPQVEASTSLGGDPHRTLGFSGMSRACRDNVGVCRWGPQPPFRHDFRAAELALAFMQKPRWDVAAGRVEAMLRPPGQGLNIPQTTFPHIRRGLCGNVEAMGRPC